jgi:hypothetical protein
MLFRSLGSRHTRSVYDQIGWEPCSLLPQARQHPAACWGDSAMDRSAMATRFRGVHGLPYRPATMVASNSVHITQMHGRLRPPFVRGASLERPDMTGVGRLAHNSRSGPAVRPNAPQCGTVGPLVGLIRPEPVRHLGDKGWMVMRLQVRQVTNRPVPAGSLFRSVSSTKGCLFDIGDPREWARRTDRGFIPAPAGPPALSGSELH